VVAGDKRLSYGSSTGARTSSRTIDRGRVGPDILVGLFVERSLDMVVGLLNILKAGAPTCRSIRRLRKTGSRS
jgi:non-ribosomal peptide synthetase component F